MFAHFRRTKTIRKAARSTLNSWKLQIEQLEDRSVPSNLIANGDFDHGDSGFTTAYRQASGSAINLQEYLLVTDPGPYNYLGVHYGDHTTGTGRMMAVNAAAVPDVVVWSQTVAVSSNTSYDFEAWHSSWVSGLAGPTAPLDFWVNGTSIGTATAPTAGGVWQRFAGVWNSGSNTSATVTIVVPDPEPNGNGMDFALDDISLRGPDTDIDMQSAQLQSANTVQFTYQTTGNPGPFEVGLFRSTDGITYNPADLIDSKPITPDPAGGQGTDSFTLSSPMFWAADYPYLLVVADPNNDISEANEDNNGASLDLPKPHVITIKQLGKTIINPINRYSEDTVLLAEVLFAQGHPQAGQRDTSFNGPVTLTELTDTHYYNGLNGASLLPQALLTTEGVVKFTIRSLSESSELGGPPDALIKATASTADDAYSLNAVWVDQWVDNNNKGGVDWLEEHAWDILHEAQRLGGELKAVVKAVSGVDQTEEQYKNDRHYGYTHIGGSVIYLNPTTIAAEHRTNANNRLVYTVLHEARHAWQFAQSRTRSNDVDGDYLVSKADYRTPGFSYNIIEEAHAPTILPSLSGQDAFKDPWEQVELVLDLEADYFAGFYIGYFRN